MRFSGKVAIVTGAGGGLGAVYASMLAKEGASVVVVDRAQNAVEQTAAGLHDAGAACVGVAADLVDPDQAARMASETLAAYGRIDILINNAGGGSSTPGNAGSIAEMDPDAWDTLVDINLKTAFLCTRAVAPAMKQQCYGKIVNVSSRSARLIDANFHQSPAYASAKTAVLALTRFAARELGPFGVTVNCLVPSLALSGPVLEDYWRRMDPAQRELYLQQVALRRLPRLEEIAAAVMFLCSDESGYITGVALDVNGGSYMPP